MKDTRLSPDEIERMRSVFRRVPAISEVVLYGSRARGTHRPGSALVGLDDPVQAAAVEPRVYVVLIGYCPISRRMV